MKVGLLLAAGVMAAARHLAGATFAARAALAGVLGLLLDLSGITTPVCIVPGAALVATRADPVDRHPAPGGLPLLASRIAVGVGLLALTVPAIPLLAIGLGVPGCGTRTPGCSWRSRPRPSPAPFDCSCWAASCSTGRRNFYGSR